MRSTTVFPQNHLAPNSRQDGNVHQPRSPNLASTRQCLYRFWPIIVLIIVGICVIVISVAVGLTGNKKASEFTIIPTAEDFTSMETMTTTSTKTKLDTTTKSSATDDNTASTISADTSMDITRNTRTEQTKTAVTSTGITRNTRTEQTKTAATSTGITRNTQTEQMKTAVTSTGITRNTRTEQMRTTATSTGITRNTQTEQMKTAVTSTGITRNTRTEQMRTTATSTVGTKKRTVSIVSETTTARPLIVLNHRSNTIIGLYNTKEGKNNGGTYKEPLEAPPSAMDGSTITKYFNYVGDTMPNSKEAGPGINTGFIVTPSISNSTIACSLRFATGNDEPDRDPIIVTLEGSNATTTDLLELGTSWIPIYRGPTGISATAVPDRSTYGTQQNFTNATPFASYRLLVTSKRNTSTGVQYSEVEILGYI